MWFSGVILGYSITLLPSDMTYIGFSFSLFFQLNALLHILSLICGVLFTFNRVRDFDLTAQVARKREQDKNDSSLKELRAKVKKFGGITRRLYAGQVILFSIGSIIFIVLLILIYSPALYQFQK